MEQKKKKTKINFITLGNFLQGKTWEELTKEEKLKVSGKILKQMFPNSQK